RVAGERPRARDRARIAGADVLAREDREQFGLAALRGGGRLRGGEPDLRADVILVDLERRGEVGARAVELRALEPGVATAVQRGELGRRRGERALEGLARRRGVVLGG